VQSTNKKPHGALELRVYPGNPGEGRACGGSLYLDDGKTMAYRHGEFLRVNFTCSESAAGTLRLHIGAHEGAYAPWWKQIHVTVFGASAKGAEILMDGRHQPIALTHEAQSTSFTVDDGGKGMDLELSE
jgi:alpha-glucosidase